MRKKLLDIDRGDGQVNGCGMPFHKYEYLLNDRIPNSP